MLAAWILFQQCQSLWQTPGVKTHGIEFGQMSTHAPEQKQSYIHWLLGICTVNGKTDIH